jgi:hypothetical protein
MILGKTWLYLANPKTGSTSVESVLEKYGIIVFPGRKHMTGGEAKMRIPWFDDLWVFTFIREEEARLRSFWESRKRHGQMQQTFEEFKANPEANKIFVPQWKYTKYADFVGTIEHLQSDFNKVCDHLGIPRTELPHLNKGEYERD